MNFKTILKKINRSGDLHIKKYGKKSFSNFAAEKLNDVELHKIFDPKEFINSSITLLPFQHFKFLEFSDLPLTISVGESCFIDLYFWRRRPTVVHDHHFRGAFTCLYGNNLDFEYEFLKTKKLSRFYDIGQLKLKDKRQVKIGDVIEINYLDKFIHQNHHHADLTVNLCFRTPQDKKHDLSNYLYSGLRFSKNDALMERCFRLKRGLDLGVVDIKKVKLSADDALMFLLAFHDSSFIEAKRYLHLIVKKEYGINVKKLLESHDKKFIKIEDLYE